MCTVTFWPRGENYELGMSRDEQRTRAKGIPPKIWRGDTKIVSPSENGGGTWIALNEHGLTLALINWYSVTPAAAPIQKPISRGEIVRTMAHVESVEELNHILLRVPLNLYQPFRLLCFS